jgi:cell wall-associated NlpC family hydrolase
MPWAHGVCETQGEGMAGLLEGHAKARKAAWAAAGCGLLVAAGLAVPSQRWKLDGNPAPSASQVHAARSQVSQRAAALGREKEKLAAASARLTSLETQAEVLTEQYDKTAVQEQQAAATYRSALARLAAARHAEQASRRQVASLAASEYETNGGFGTMAAMLGDANGPQAYLNQVSLGKLFAEQRTGILARNQADRVIATVFRDQARSSLAARQAAVRRAARLKVAVQAAVARQLAAVKQTRALTARLASALASARTHARSLAAERQAALAAEAAAQARSAGAGPSSSQAPPAPVPGGTAGDIAANWALSQLGKPYQWGGAGPDTYDCSGLTMDAWAHAGVRLLHYTGYQWQEGQHVPLDQLQRGDLLFYATNNSDPATIHHVGIYIGNGEMVDAPYTGADVRIDSIYQPGYPIGAVRP